MAVLTGLTFGGKTWTPKFVQSIDEHKCIGCGRCFKICGHDVLLLRAMNEEGEFVDDEDDDEIEKKVMTVAHPENCIGCGACSRICPKNCYTHVELNN
ncbi:ferredoxin III, nif-specific [Fischerella thermalis]|uniref:Ferredoxin III n=1 Tax=Fischerella thermalis CCMEE 5318 TaxID=2019666 RepID=A0A2N6L516_9CYAN|nr:ferredoxin III, nif-specific [Fischerella thermalis]PMB28266.1 ferredoxin III, nif-specific [Fischerella thermalis CCMEE 5319]PMB39248.1 ferredoxin III, nif-specific [Fischerella thermalis CCMEE 5205]MBF1990878.1 ferredoxin III, nif-specific [Fischerella thermalis M58_A2018_009]MBF2061632.1 ferredoxin III, nif-specific [Fischerella thermalis M66_A2018_004]MBF2071641.1 ferredoxin III, nif-specific [Fischerella thermalis M48_A2018_028]